MSGSEKTVGLFAQGIGSVFPADLRNCRRSRLVGKGGALLQDAKKFVQNRNGPPGAVYGPERERGKLRQGDIAQVRQPGVRQIRQYRIGVSGLEQRQYDLQIIAKVDAAGLPAAYDGALDLQQRSRADPGAAMGPIFCSWAAVRELLPARG